MKAPMQSGVFLRLQSWPVLVVLAILAVFFGIMAQLPSPEAGIGSLALELPGTSDSALAILRALTDAGMVRAAQRAILWDFPFIVSYVLALGILLTLLPAPKGLRSEDLAPYAGWGVVIAGALDLVENVGMLFILNQEPSKPGDSLGLVAGAVTLAALFKWTIIIAVASFSLWENINRRRGRRTR